VAEINAIIISTLQLFSCMFFVQVQVRCKTAMVEPKNIEVGKRIENDGYYGTIRYVGALDTTSATKVHKDITWVGVEWDKPCRGKHDGSYHGVQYFTTTHASGGSFLRPEKCNFGVTLMAALVDRYCGPNASSKLSELSEFAQSDVSELDSAGADGSHEKKSYLSKRSTAGVHGMFVSDGGKDGEIAPYLANVTELDLSLNLLTDWLEIAMIINQIPQLKVLNVSDNRLRLHSDVGCVSCDICVLYLNRMDYDWSKVSCCAQLFSHLRELHACYNQIEGIGNVLVSPFTEISLVNVEGNPISSWNGLLPLGDLPHLQTLIANECGLTFIHLPGNSSPSNCFVALESLSISRNEIADWLSINELNRLQSLSSLRFACNPLSQDSKAADARHTAIAKIANLQWCNGAAILRGERQGAELDYVRVYSLEWKRAGGNETLDGPLDETFVMEHPRYVELARKHGPVEQPELQQKKSSALKNYLVTVQIRSKYSSELLTRRLPTKMTVQKLKVLVQRAFKIADVSTISLMLAVFKEPCEGKQHGSPSHCESQEVHAHIEMDNDLRELSFYSLENDAVIDVEW